jgi:hypothetical protein
LAESQKNRKAEMAKVTIPKPKRAGTKGSPIIPKAPTGNLETASNTDAAKTKTVGLNFKVSEEFQTRFKMTAVQEKMKLNAMLEKLLDFYEENK